MKATSLKIVSAALVASMTLSVVACSKKGGKTGDSGERHSGKKITADTPWYDGEVKKIEADIDTSKPLEYSYSELAGIDSDYIIIHTNGYYKMPTGNDIDWENFNYNDYSINLISVIDRNTYETVNKIDLNKELDKNGYISGATYFNGKLSVYESTFDETTYASITTEKVMDPMTGVVSEEKVQTDEENQSGIERTFQVGNYKVQTSMNWDNNDSAYYILFIEESDGNIQKVKLKETGLNLYDIPAIISLGDDKALIPCSTDKSQIYYELDLKNAKAKKIEGNEYDWLEMDSLYTAFNSPDGFTYYTTPSGILKIDVKNKTTEEVLNYSWCTVSRSIINYLQIVDISEDSIVLCGDCYTYNPYEYSQQSNFVMVELTKAETNPHAGKTVLELFSTYGYVEERINDAIIKYNDSSSDYFIEVTDRYTANDDVNYNDLNSEDDWQTASLNSNANMSNELAMDILNGEGPDILMNVSYMGQLNSTNYLADLTPYIGSLDPDKYFTNIVDAAKVDGKLFHLPVCFMIDGIQTDEKYAGASGVGFTTDEYEKFLNETLNGEDVITLGRAHYFARLFESQRENFIVNGKVDFSGPEFEQLATFCRDNVRESSKNWDEMYTDDDIYYEESVAYAVGAATAPVKADRGYYSSSAIYTNCYGISTYFMQMAQLKGAGAILGLPSTDGRGPMVEPYVSVAISAQAQNIDACAEFVKLLLSDEVQKNLAMSDNFVINREAFREGGMTAVEYYNGEGGENMFGYDFDTGMPIDESKRIKLSEQNVNDMEAIIESCSTMYSADAAIDLILVEELPAYFLGQKSLDDVVRVAQDRAQKVIDERG